MWRFLKRARAYALLASMPMMAGIDGCGNQSGDLKAERFGDLPEEPVPRTDALAAIASTCQPWAEGAPLRRRPYLQQVTESSARLLWTTDGDAGRPLSVAVKTTDGAPAAQALALRDESARPGGGGLQWIASVTALRPATTYCYEVRADGRLLAQAPFRTAPAPGSNQPVRFLVFGDSGSGSADQRALLTQMRTVPFDLVLHVGDLAYDHGTRWEIESHVFRVYADLLQSFPMFPASGNHEYDTEDAAPFREAFDLPLNGGPHGRERWYSFDWGDVHFVVLDTERTGPTQAAWLNEDLSRNRLPWTIVYMHRPPFSSGDHGNDLASQRTFVPLFEKHRVPLVLAGHDHHYERTTPRNGVTYVVTGGGGKGTRPVGTNGFTAFQEQVVHFVHVTVEGDRLRLHAIDGTGAEFDSVTLAR